MSEVKTGGLSHEKIETSNFLMIVLILLVLLVGGLVEIVPLFFQKSTTQAIEGLKPLSPLQLAGRDVYIAEGCYGCHSQQIRPFRSEVLRYGPHSVAGEFVYDYPFQWGSKRTGPDLARVGGRYNDEWHRLHLLNPRALVPESNMPAYPWFETTPVDAASIPKRMEALRKLGVPYTDEEIKGAQESLKGKTQMDAVIAYLQSLGLARSNRPIVATETPATTPVATNDTSATKDKAASEPKTIPAEGESGAVLEGEVAKLYFASGKADLNKDASEVLKPLVEAAKQGAKLRVSGFHDTSGDPAKNAELAKQRAFAVRDALVAAGVAESAIELKKPEKMADGGDASMARRVEVSKE
jgi:cytochrome c oxidase cbb3-type subunit 2